MIDTRDKRASVLGFGLAALLVLPEPGTIDQPDRQHVAYSYRGIQAASPTPPSTVEPTVIAIEADDRIIAVPASDRTIAIEADDRVIAVPAKGSH